MITFQRAIIALAVLALFTGLAKCADAQPMAMTEKQFLDLYSTKAAKPILAKYKGKEVELEYRTMEDRHKNWFKVLYLFSKPASTQDWFLYQIHQEEISTPEGDIKTKVFARILESTKKGPVVVKGYAGASIEESFEVLRKFLEEKFDLSIPADTKL
jgi:hypothetical protein